jgi:hypothetical protein
MLQSRNELRLGLEARDELAFLMMFEHFDGHKAIQRRLVCLVDCRHPAAPNQFDEMIWPEIGVQ